jgi:DNA modification methylase
MAAGIIEQNKIIQGDCTEILRTLPTVSVDFALTHPPYFVRYKDRAGRTIRNDSYPGHVLDAFRDVYRILKPDTLCVSFYGWNRVDVLRPKIVSLQDQFGYLFSLRPEDSHDPASFPPQN